MEGKSRRSLLPQISATSHHSKESRLPAPNSSVGRSAGLERGISASVKSQIPHQEIESPVVVPQHDNNIQAVPPKATHQQPKANVGRSLSLRHPSTQVSHVQYGVQRVPSTRPRGPSTRVSRIATPKVSHSPTKETDSPFSPPRQIGKSIIDTPDDESLASGIKKSQLISKARAESTLPNSAVSRQGRASSQQITASQKANLPSSSASEAGLRPTKPTRPAFSTLQQHFTPRKAPKALTSSFLAPPIKDTEAERASAEIAGLQAELARLHLLHRNSEEVQKAWNESAKHHLQLQFDGVSRLCDDIAELSSSQRRLHNFPAVLDWSQSVSKVEFTERLQILSRSLTDLGNLLGSGSKYQRVMTTFEGWFDSANLVLESRKTADDGSLDFIEEIEDSWKAEVTSMSKKMTTMSRELERLGKPQADSTLGRIVGLLRNASSSMLEELESIKAIESAVMASEAEWIHKEASGVVSETNDRNQSSVPLQARAWHGI